MIDAPNADSGARYEWAVADESGHLHPVENEASALRTAALNPKYRIFRRLIVDWQPVYQSLAPNGSYVREEDSAGS